MSKIQTKARRWEQWWNDPVRAEVMSEIQDAQTAVFLNTASTQEDREAAHQIVCAIKQLEQRIHRASSRAVVEQKGKHRGND